MVSDSDTMHAEEMDRPWVDLGEAVRQENEAAVQACLDDLCREERRRAMAHLDEDEQVKAVGMLSADGAAELLSHLPKAQTTAVLEKLPAAQAADIVEIIPEELSSDLLRGMHGTESDAVLAELEHSESAGDLRELSSYPSGTAGALMTKLFAAFQESSQVGDVVSKLSGEAERYGDMDVQYVYVVNEREQLQGVLRLRDLVLTPRNCPVLDVMVRELVSVNVQDDFDTLRKVFEERNYIGLPVVDDQGVIVGVVTQQAVKEATAEQQTGDYLHSAGILGGEELRSMPIGSRCIRRLAWLVPNIVLNLVAASVIAMYEDTLQAVIALAVFLPIVSDMSGCSGNQAVAVSMRELTLGLIRPNEFGRIMWREGALGMINGFVLGCLLGLVAGLWKDNVYLGVVIGSALFLNTILSVVLGGCVPLLLKRLKVDPALASGPVLTTCTDMCGFFIVLNLASLALTKMT